MSVGRVNMIIACMLEAEDYLSAEDIAKALQVSKRTVFRDLSAVEEKLSTYGLELEKKARRGMRLQGSPEALAQVSQQVIQQKKVITKEDRQKHIITELLRQRTPQKLYYFATALQVSEATISGDMDKIEPWFEKRDIELVRKPGLGVYLEGREKNIRKAITDFLYQHYDYGQLQELMNFHKSEQTVADLISQADQNLLSLISKDILFKVGGVLKRYEGYIEKRLTDSAYIGLLVHLSIAIQRLLNHERISMNHEVLRELQQDTAYEKAREIGLAIEETFSIVVPEDELGYITMHLKGSKLRNTALSTQEDAVLSNFEVSSISLKMIRAFKRESGIDLSQDQKLLTGLVSHLRPAITRIKLGLDIRNPLLDKIQEMYPEIYRMTSLTAKVLAQQYKAQVPAEEIGFLAMHFGAALERQKKHQIAVRPIRIGVVCSSGIGTSSLLASRITKVFDQVEIVGQYPKEDVVLKQVGQNEVDLFLTTIDLGLQDFPCIQVSPLLTEVDIQKVKDVLGMVKRNLSPMPVQVKKTSDALALTKTMHAYTEGILQVESSFLVRVLSGISNVTKLIDQATLALNFPTKERKKLRKRLLMREQLGSTILREDQLILLHTKTQKEESLQVGVFRLSPPIETREGSIKTALMMLVPEEAAQEKLELMSFFSKELIENETFVSMLHEAGEEEVKSYILKRLHEILQQRIQSW